MEIDTRQSAPPRHLLSFRPEVTLEPAEGAVDVVHPWGRYRLRGLRPASAAALARLAAPGPVEPAELAAEPEDAAELA
jgi:hypothetical protein